ncbi:hypothetical protein BC830DRAFT_1200411 [Chytriomyces sp. MP71]|nr:hypothetical protein BC830DRAFT_1200411 [Chytriomyces sp. MP71]
MLGKPLTFRSEEDMNIDLAFPSKNETSGTLCAFCLLCGPSIGSVRDARPAIGLNRAAYLGPNCAKKTRQSYQPMKARRRDPSSPHVASQDTKISDEELSVLEVEAILKAASDRIRLKPVHNFYLALTQWELDHEAFGAGLSNGKGLPMDVAQSRRVLSLLMKLYPPTRFGSVGERVNVAAEAERFVLPGSSGLVYLGFDE